MAIPIVDSHIHLFAASHLPTIAWHSPSNPLGSQHSVSEYRHATSSTPTNASNSNANPTYLKGFVFVETDRKSSLSPKDWQHPLEEVSFLARIASGKPIEGEGHEAGDRDLCLAIIPWAPVPAGQKALQTYIAQVRERTESHGVWTKVVGVRYLVQDKQAGTMLEEDFVEGLKWLGQQGLSFDLGVDARQGGFWQLEEAVEMLKRVSTSKNGEVDTNGSELKVIINHMCKPNLRLQDEPSLIQHPDYSTWAKHIETLARFPNTYMKLSGLFSELPVLPPFTSEEKEAELIASTVSEIKPWTDVVFDHFGSHRIMFGSDWPVCNVGGGGNQAAWVRWKRVVENILEDRKLNDDKKKDVWGGVAGRAYRCMDGS